MFLADATGNTIVAHDRHLQSQVGRHLEDSVVAADFGVSGPGSSDEGHGGVGRVDVGLALGPRGCDRVGEVVERVQLCCLGRRNKLDRIADVGADPELRLQLVEFTIVVRNPETTRPVIGDLAPGPRGERVVGLDGVVMERRRR